MNLILLEKVLSKKVSISFTERDKTMKKIIPLLILSLIILSPIFAESVDATTVFLTSDNLHEHDADFARLNDIKNRIESKTNGDIIVVVDDSASNPGEGTRLIHKCRNT